MNSIVAVVKNGRKYDVTIDGEVVSSHKTKTAAIAEKQAEEAALSEKLAKADAAAMKRMGGKAPAILTPEPVTVGTVDATGTVTLDEGALEALAEEIVAAQAKAAQYAEIAAMDRVARLMAAQAEAHALRDWKQTKATPTPPATPIIDWMTDPEVNVKKQTKAGTVRKGQDFRTPEQTATFIKIVTEGVAAGAKYSEMGKALEAAGIPRSASGDTRWTSGWITAVAGRLNVSLKREDATV